MVKDKWNAWHGCKKCSEGCQNCYMYYLDKKRQVKTPSSLVHKTNNFNYPLMKTRNGKYKVGSGEKIMVNMTSDTFIEEADEWRDEMWDIIKQRPDVIFWVLTKRPERFAECMPSDWGDGYDNVSLNITCENQTNFALRIRYLLNIPAKHKGLCLAPLLGPIDIDFALRSGQIEEVSVGGENYDNPRPCNYDWVKDIAMQCRNYGVNFYYYETGTMLVFKGDTYVVSSKTEQAKLAFMSGLTHKFYDVHYDLKDLKGLPLERSDVFTKMFNKNHCVMCGNQQSCNGCYDCGDCKTVVEYITEDELKALQDNYVKLMLS